MIEVTFNVISSIQNFIQIHQSVLKLHGLQNFKRPPYWNGLRYGIKNVMSRLSSMASPAYQISWNSTDRFKRYWGGGHRQTNRQARDLTSLLSFLNKWKVRKKIMYALRKRYQFYGPRECGITLQAMYKEFMLNVRFAHWFLLTYILINKTNKRIAI
jgi:hypothetical protein